jgi:hypothetical protein
VRGAGWVGRGPWRRTEVSKAGSGIDEKAQREETGTLTHHAASGITAKWAGLVSAMLYQR